MTGAAPFKHFNLQRSRPYRNASPSDAPALSCSRIKNVKLSISRSVTSHKHPRIVALKKKENYI